jgi:hypothetical protein
MQRKLACNALKASQNGMNLRGVLPRASRDQRAARPLRGVQIRDTMKKARLLFPPKVSQALQEGHAVESSEGVTVFSPTLVWPPCSCRSHFQALRP